MEQVTVTRRRRRLGSIRAELLEKAREAALSAVQMFNNPLLRFKSELFIVTMQIAWTYMLHAFYRSKRIEYREFDLVHDRRRFRRTAGGAIKYWGLQRCLDEDGCPLDTDTRNNLRFLAGIRNEIEHQMTTRIDDHLSAKFQASCLNFNQYIKKLFGPQYGIDKHLAFSLQFSHISRDQVEALETESSLPTHILSYIRGFEESLTEDQFNSPQFAYRVLFVPKTANRRGQADEVIEFVKADSDVAKAANVKYAAVKETERPKFSATQVVGAARADGFGRFGMHDHTLLWKELDAKNPAKGYGTLVVKTWYWYERWVDVVRAHCRENAERFR
jgi:hypothetical protein